MKVAVAITPKNEARREVFAEPSRFQVGFYDILDGPSDALFEPTDALLCTDGPLKTLADLLLSPEHRHGHSAMYGRSTRASWTWTGFGRRWRACRFPEPPTAGWS